jgi:hypothetical protein
MMMPATAMAWPARATNVTKYGPSEFAPDHDREGGQGQCDGGEHRNLGAQVVNGGQDSGGGGEAGTDPDQYGDGQLQRFMHEAPVGHEHVVDGKRTAAAVMVQGVA